MTIIDKHGMGWRFLRLVHLWYGNVAAPEVVYRHKRNNTCRVIWAGGYLMIATQGTNGEPVARWLKRVTHKGVQNIQWSGKICSARSWCGHAMDYS